MVIIFMMSNTGEMVNRGMQGWCRCHSKRLVVWRVIGWIQVAPQPNLLVSLCGLIRGEANRFARTKPPQVPDLAMSMLLFQMSIYKLIRDAWSVVCMLR